LVHTTLHPNIATCTGHRLLVVLVVGDVEVTFGDDVLVVIVNPFVLVGLLQHFLHLASPPLF